MAVRDEKYNWKKESLELSSEINKSLASILEKALDMGFTAEDFIYMVSFSMTEVCIDHSFKEKSRLKGDN